jgi:hypothetical protein
LTDAAGALESLADAARQHGASAFWGGPLRLAPLVKEHYLSFIAASFPALRPAYEGGFPHADAPRGYRDAIERRLAQVRHEFGFAAEDRKAEPVSGQTLRVGEAVAQQLAMPLPA